MTGHTRSALNIRLGNLPNWASSSKLNQPAKLQIFSGDQLAQAPSTQKWPWFCRVAGPAAPTNLGFYPADCH